MVRSALLGLVLAALLAGASSGVPEGPPVNAGSAGNVTVECAPQIELIEADVVNDRGQIGHLRLQGYVLYVPL